MSTEHRTITPFLLMLLCVVVSLPGLLDRPVLEDETASLIAISGAFDQEFVSQIYPAQLLTTQLTHQSATLGEIVTDLSTHDPQNQPLYFILLAGWRAIGSSSLQWARLLSLVLTSAATFIVYAVMRRINVGPAGLATLVFVIANGTVSYASQARHYALATLLVSTSLLLALLAVERMSPSTTRRATWYAFGSALAAGLAFQTTYLTWLTVAVIQVWLFVYAWRYMRLRAFLFPVVASAVAAIGIQALLGLIGSERNQFAGFVGWRREIFNDINLTLATLYLPRFMARDAIRRFENVFALIAVYGFYASLILAGLIALIRQRTDTQRSLWILVPALAAAPGVGLLITNAITDQHLDQYRYMLQAVPWLALLLAKGIYTLTIPRPVLRWGLLAAVLLLQGTTVYWGFWADDFRDARWGRLADEIHTTATDSTVIVSLDDPLHYAMLAPLAFEISALDPHFPIIPIDDEADLATVAALAAEFDHVWITGRTRPPDKMALLQQVRDAVIDGGSFGVLRLHEESFVGGFNMSRTLATIPSD